MTPRAARRWLGMAFLLSLVLVNPYVRGDGNGYYAWLVSPAIDGDFDFENQYRHADPVFRSLMFDVDGGARDTMKAPTGHLANQWSVGPAVLWSPWFAVAHAAVRVAQLWTPALAADGYSWPYRYTCAIGTAVYGWLALLLAWRAAELVGFTAAAPIAVAIVWAATPLPVYQYFLPFHVPALEAFGVSLFVWGWLSLRPFARASQWAAWGAIAGLMTEIYQLTGVLLLIAAYELVVVARRDGLRRGIVSAATFGLAGLIVWMPQLIGKAVVYGTPWTTGYHDQFFWTQPRLLQTAISAEHGLFSWTPVAVLAAAGLIVAARTRVEFRVLLAVSAVFFYAVASYQNWHGRSSFGNRFFVGLVVCGVMGLAALWSAAGPARPIVRRLGVAVALALALWNAGLAIQWGTDIIPNQGPVDFRQVARNQVTAVPAEALRFLRLYFSSRDEVIRRIEERVR
jgi:hypothetical protein